MVSEVWKTLQSHPDSALIDVRTRAEWTFVGVPDLSPLGKRVLTVEWQTFPDSQLNAAFGTQLKSLLDQAGVNKNSELFFICRSGARSRMAAEAAMAAGFTNSRNVAEGFEGPLDDKGQRGKVAGWKAEGLPWMQG